MNPRIPRFFGAAAVASVVVFASSAGATVLAGRYTASGGTVTDTKTKLVWQQTVPSTHYNWADAKTYCAGAGASLGGTGWRLPTMKELQTIVDDSRTNPSIDPTAFPGTPAYYFLSSSPVAGSPSVAWSVDFVDGYSYSYSMPLSYNVRCVR